MVFDDAFFKQRPALVPKPIREYPLVHYRRMTENG